MKNKKSGTDVSFFCEEKMKDLTFRQLQAYLLEHYQQSRTEEGLFIKLVEGNSYRYDAIVSEKEYKGAALSDVISQYYGSYLNFPI